MFWRFIAWLVIKEPVFRFLQWWGAKHPYKHVVHKGNIYMNRWWIVPRFRNLPSIRLHHIRQADIARDMHSHPFNFKTIILRGWYIQQIPDIGWPKKRHRIRIMTCDEGQVHSCHYKHFHRITHVSPDGCWTLFISWGGKRHDWGFMTDKGYVQARDYKGNYEVEHE